MPNNDSHYGTYMPGSPVNRPISERLTVEAGEGTKGIAKKNATATMTAPPEFIKRFKPTKCGKHKNHLDIGIEEWSASDCSEVIDASLSGVERHIVAMAAGDDDELADFIFDNIDNL